MQSLASWSVRDLIRQELVPSATPRCDCKENSLVIFRSNSYPLALCMPPTDSNRPAMLCCAATLTQLVKASNHTPYLWISVILSFHVSMQARHGRQPLQVELASTVCFRLAVCSCHTGRGRGCSLWLRLLLQRLFAVTVAGLSRWPTGSKLGFALALLATSAPSSSRQR